MKHKLMIFTIAICFCITLKAGTVITNGNIGSSKKDCTGLGICKSNTTIQEQLTMHWNAISQDKTLELHLNKIELAEKQAHTAALFHGKTKLIFEEDIEIPMKVVNVFELTSNVIPAGNYKLIQTHDEYIIVFTF